MKREILIVAIMLALGAGPAGATSFILSPDAPTDDPAGSTAVFRPWDIVRNDSGTYTTMLILPAGTAVDAVYRLSSGDWLFSVEAAADLGSAVFDPRDLILFDGVDYSLFLDGAAAGIPPEANIDALFLDGGDSGDPVVSLDIPALVGGSSYGPGDLLKWDGAAFALYFDAASAGLPIQANVTGADKRAGLLILTLDTPVTLGTGLLLPGQLLSWDGASLNLYYEDPAWPVSSRLDGVAFLPPPGVVPHLSLEKSVAVEGDLTISWSAACSAGAADYAVYEGSLGNWYDHVPVTCTDTGADLEETFTPGDSNRYYLLTSHNANDEGSYGISHTNPNEAGAERPPSTAACVVSQELDPCP